MEHYPESPLTLWFRPPVATNRRRAPLIDPAFLIILIPTLAVVFIFFVLPPLLSHVTSHILKPGSVKSTWDSLNIFLVLFAILCGIMARRNDDVSSSGGVDCFVAERSDTTVESSGQWVGFDVDMYYIHDPTRRIENSNRSTGGVHQRSRRSEEDFSDVKDIVVDTLVVNPNATKFREQAPSSSSKRHSFRSVGKNIVKVEVPTNDLDKVIRSHSSPLPLLLPPPTTELKVQRSQHKKLERKVSNIVATAISSLYNQKKGKNKRNLRNMSPEIVQPRQTPAPPPPPPLPPPPSVFKNLFAKHKRIHSVPATVPPPPPPPPPRPTSIFNNIFKSGSKSRRFHSPSPVPPSSIMNTLFINGTKSKRLISCINAASSPPPPPPPPPLPPPRYTVKSKQLSTPTLEAQNRRGTSKGKPPLPKKTSGYHERDDFLTSGSQSPLVPVPPPPPPFKMSDMKFDFVGDFVKVRSTRSSVCSSPDHDDVDLASMMVLVGGGGSSIGPGSGLISFDSSPDVNAKADSFISRLKDEWRMEKNNYVKDKMG